MLSLSACTTDTDMVGPPRPIGTEIIRAPMPENSVYLFQDRNFRGDVGRVDHIGSMPSGTVADVPMSFGVSSARWKLPPGVLVVLYGDRGGRGNQIPLWGSGEVPSFSQWHSNDKVSEWAWYNVGGTSGAASPPGERSPRPIGAQPTTAMAPASIELFQDADFRGTMTSIGPVTEIPAESLQKPVGAADRMTSLRWNLPPGVVVVLYEDAQARGRQLTLFGSGQYTSVSPWNFNDRVSRWAWYDVGAR